MKAILLLAILIASTNSSASRSCVREGSWANMVAKALKAEARKQGIEIESLFYDTAKSRSNVVHHFQNVGPVIGSHTVTLRGVRITTARGSELSAEYVGQREDSNLYGDMPGIEARIHFEAKYDREGNMIGEKCTISFNQGSRLINSRTGKEVVSFGDENI